MSAQLRPQPQPHLRPVTLADLDTLMAIEDQAYPVPWTRGNFIDSLAAGYLAIKLTDEQGRWLGYYVAMAGVEEMHLLNLTVVPEHEGHGHARAMLDDLVARSREAGAAQLWLEVRLSNTRAQALYRRYGFAELGRRRAYYPTRQGPREDALVMSLRLAGDQDALD